MNDNQMRKCIEAVALRPLLWKLLTEPQQHVLRGTINEHALTAIGQTIGGPPMSASLVRRIQVNIPPYILKKQRKLIYLERQGLGTAFWIKFFMEQNKK